jgi:hypothetical protein
MQNVQGQRANAEVYTHEIKIAFTPSKEIIPTEDLARLRHPHLDEVRSNPL